MHSLFYFLQPSRETHDAPLLMSTWCCSCDAFGLFARQCAKLAQMLTATRTLL
jgi:hypothetical protein